MKLSYTGTLETYFETGFESISLQLYLDKFKVKNKEFNPKDKSFGPKYWHDWSGVISLKRGDQVTILKTHPLLKKYEGKTYTIGNQKLASKEGFKLGGCYPKEKISIKNWYLLFSCEKTKAKVIKKVNSIAYYGGTFDPIHNGHKKIIDNLRYQYDLIIIIPGNNWTKNNPPIFPLDQRINSLKAVCHSFHNIKVLDWSLKKDTSSTYNVVNLIINKFGIIPSIVIGGDNVLNIEKWKNWNLLKKLQFVIFDRKIDSNVDLSKFEKKPIFWKNQTGPTNISSTNIRNTKDISEIPIQAIPFLDLNLLKNN